MTSLGDISISDLELSVRAVNALRNIGVTPVEQFMKLDRGTVLRTRSAGAKTWREIRDMQPSLRDHGALADAEVAVFRAAAALNCALADAPAGLKAGVTRDGNVAIYRRVFP